MTWLVMGDFNETMWVSNTSEGQMALFREVLNNCDLTDLGFTGLPFTYDAGREGRQCEGSLDRAVADTNWRDSFGDVVLHHLVSSRSDHRPLSVVFRNQEGKLGET
jgi:endonuclease/exonuclease/phosphatase family metal-dependent hydrolase